MPPHNSKNEANQRGGDAVVLSLIPVLGLSSAVTLECVGGNVRDFIAVLWDVHTGSYELFGIPPGQEVQSISQLGFSRMH
jgi:hypothetical protein